MDKDPRNSPPTRTQPRVALRRFRLRSYNDRVIPVRVIRAVEEILLLTECWKRPQVRTRDTH